MKLHSIAKAALTLSLLAAPCLAQAPRSAQDHFNRGGSHYKKGDFEGAIADCDRALAINQRLYDAYNNRGVARYALND